MKTPSLIFAVILSTIAAVTAQEKVVNAYGTIANLIQLNPNTPNNVIVLQGLSSVADGQGGIFAYVPNSGSSTNSTNVFATTYSGATGNWIRQFSIPGISLTPDGIVFSNTVQSVNGLGGAFTLPLQVQTANRVLAGPTSGGAAAPTFRAVTLASADFANQGTTTTLLHGNASGNPSFGAAVLTTDVSGVLPIANGGTASATASAAKTAFGIQSGTATTAADSTVTNVFGTAFSSAPVVIITPTVSLKVVTNSVVSATSSQFIANLGGNAITFNWIAVGAP